MKRLTAAVLLYLCLYATGYAGSPKISGYIQTQYQWNEQEALGRFGIRRGRIKLTSEEGTLGGVFQLDITEKGVGVKDAYLSLKDPRLQSLTFKAGIFDRPFGNEISYSSSRRESPERSAIFQTLFPEERDLGASLTLQAPETSPWNFLKLEAGLFTGNGIKQETDKRKDFIGHLSAVKEVGNDIKISGGLSYYNGGVFQGNNRVYTMTNAGFVLDSLNNKGRFAKREYIGLDAQCSITGIYGMTQLRAEYLFGTQPGSPTSTKSPNASTLPTTDTYIRHFSGGYVIFVQDIKQSPFSAVLKCDWYDPNTKIAKNKVGQNGTGTTDLAQNTIGFGALWRASNATRLQAFYETGKNDQFTLRLQYKF